MSNSPIIAAKSPVTINLEKGETYYWCRCGRSASQPFCDGSHAGTDITPLAFTAETSGPANLCRCKGSGNQPYCDGTHVNFAALNPGDPVPVLNRDAAPAAKPTPEEPTVARIHALARDGLAGFGHHGEIGAMGVPRKDLPHWDDIQILTAQFATKPLMDNDPVGTELVIGPRAAKPLTLKIPLFVSDMSFGSLSEEAKIALARGAEMAGTGICSGEGGSLREEREANSRYFYELASAKFGWSWDLLDEVQAFHFKGGQGAKPALVGTCRPRRSPRKSRKLAGLSQARTRFRHQPLTRREPQRSFAVLAMRFANEPAESRSGSSCQRITSRLISILRWRPAQITSFLTAAVVVRVRLHSCFVITSVCRPSQHSLVPERIWTARPAGKSP